MPNTAKATKATENRRLNDQWQLRLYVEYCGERVVFYVANTHTAAQLKARVVAKFGIVPCEQAHAEYVRREKREVGLQYKKVELEDSWVLATMGIPQCGVLRAYDRMIVEPICSFEVEYSREVIRYIPDCATHVTCLVSYLEKLSPIRLRMDQSVAEAREYIRQLLRIDPAAVVEVYRRDNQKQSSLMLELAGVELKDEWAVQTLGLAVTSVIRVSLHAANDTDDADSADSGNAATPKPAATTAKESNMFGDMPVVKLRRIASELTGLPVGVFRLVSRYGQEMHDYHSMNDYGLHPGETIKVHTWDGWNDFLFACRHGDKRRAVGEMAIRDERLSQFQMRVGLYMAAHFGHADLAREMLHLGAQPHESVGSHPLREWLGVEGSPATNESSEAASRCHNSSTADTGRAAVHEAAACGKLSVLRLCVQKRVVSLIARDAAGLLPLNHAIRGKHRECMEYLITQRWKIYRAMRLSSNLVARIMIWAEHAKSRVLRRDGAIAAILANRRQYPFTGYPIHVDGVAEPPMNSKPLAAFDVLTAKNVAAGRSLHRRRGIVSAIDYVRWQRQQQYKESVKFRISIENVDLLPPLTTGVPSRKEVGGRSSSGLSRQTSIQSDDLGTITDLNTNRTTTSDRRYRNAAAPHASHENEMQRTCWIAAGQFEPRMVMRQVTLAMNISKRMLKHKG